MPHKAADLDLSQFKLGFLLHDTSRLRRTAVDKHLKILNITRSQWWVLANLPQGNKENIVQTELAADMDVGKVALGGLLDRLEANGFVKRSNDKTDRRAKRISITPAGREVLVAARDRAATLNQIIMQDNSPESIAIAEEVLAKMKKRLLQIDSHDGDNSKYKNVSDDIKLGLDAGKLAAPFS